jgi:S-DNA-T family DNA segregation ATPase FtsK/SpoIIIE
MAKNKNKDTEEQDENRFKLQIHGDAKRSIVAILLFLVAILLALGFFDVAGMLGQSLDKAIRLSFGWGKWVFPFVLIASGVILLFRKETLFYVSKLIGVVVAFVCLLGFLHVYLDRGRFLEIAAAGQGGGYVGYGVSNVLIKVSSVTAASVILGAFFLIGIIIAFNFSIVGFFKKLFSLKKSSEILAEKESGLPLKKEFVNGPEEKKEETKEEVEAAINAEKESLFNSIKRKLYAKPETPEEELSENLRVVKDDENWKFPSLDLLESSSGKAQGGDVKGNAEIIQKTLGHFGIEVELGEVKTGPTITQYTFRPAVGIKLSKITGLSDDLALALAAHPIRIEAPIPGKSLIGIEVPNKTVATVRLKDLLKTDVFEKRKSSLMLALGRNVNGECIMSDLAKLPHLLIAGSTGTGKSIYVNSIILSLLYQNSPQDLKMILVDPKRVELSRFNGIPHLLTDAIVDNGKVLSALKWAIGEMEKRYVMLQESGSRDIDSFNLKVLSGHKNKKVNTETGEVMEEEITKMPYLVIIIDELADLMMSHGKEVEGAIIRLAQMARAVGIHLIISTQRPSVEVLTGLIKANITNRIALKVATQIDSRTILDTGGAEKLLGKGDMLFLTSGSEGIRRIQGAFISEEEVTRVVKFVKKQKMESGNDDLGENIVASHKEAENNYDNQLDLNAIADAGDDDALYEDAKRVVIEAKKGSASLLQRRLRVGYARAARLLDILESKGVIGPGEGAKPREVYLAPNDTDYADPLQDQEKRDKWQM